MSNRLGFYCCLLSPTALPCSELLAETSYGISSTSSGLALESRLYLFIVGIQNSTSEIDWTRFYVDSEMYCQILKQPPHQICSQMSSLREFSSSLRSQCDLEVIDCNICTYTFIHTHTSQNYSSLPDYFRISLTCDAIQFSNYLILISAKSRLC